MTTTQVIRLFTWIDNGPHPALDIDAVIEDGLIAIVQGNDKIFISVDDIGKLSDAIERLYAQ